MNRSEMKDGLARHADVLMCAVAGMKFFDPVAVGMRPAQIAELASLLDAWCVGELSPEQHIRARMLAEAAGIDLDMIDKISAEREKDHE